MNFTNEAISYHFDILARNYGKKRIKNYYLSGIHKLIKSFMNNVSEKNVLEIGCGTGEFLNSLLVKRGIGLDISKKMIEIANLNYHGNNLKFYVGDLLKFNSKLDFDYIVLIDVIEHLADIHSAIYSLARLSNQNTIIIMSFSNPFWETPFKIFELLGLKDSEGPHNLTSIKKLKYVLYKNNFHVLTSGYRFLLPVKIPLFSNFFNSFFYKIPILRNLGMTQYIVCKQAKSL